MKLASRKLVILAMLVAALVFVFACNSCGDDNDSKGSDGVNNISDDDDSAGVGNDDDSVGDDDNADDDDTVYIPDDDDTDNLPSELDERITLPDGFTIEYYAEGVDNARSLVLSPGGILFVSTRTAGNLYAVIDDDKDYRADQVITLATGMNSPNGIAIRDGALYVAEINRVLRYDDIENNLQPLPAPVVVNDSFPSDDVHGWKFIAFGPDDKLYVPVGAPCNVCELPGAIYSTINRMNPDGSGLETFAHGVRNTVGFDWHPGTGELWFTDNGRDAMGNDIPPDELNHAPVSGMHFGFPYCHGGDIPEPDQGIRDGRSCSEFTAPKQKLGPHVAALGMRFYTGDMFPAKYKNRIFIAEHGSWNRAEKIGYRVMQVKLDNSGNAVSYEDFATGWLVGQEHWGRPVDVLEMPDGSLLVSDDYHDAVYRISYVGK